MASVYKRKYTSVVNGKKVKKQSRCWYIKYRDANGIERRVKGYMDKTATRQKAADLVKAAELEHSGVVDKYVEQRKVPLARHLDDFHAGLLAKGNTADYAKTVVTRVKKVFEDCGFVFWPDITSSKVQNAISNMRKSVKVAEVAQKNGKKVKVSRNKDLGPVSAQTRNFYLQSVRQFAKWMVQDGRAGESPVQHLRNISVKTDRRHDRRSLEPDEIRRLLEATEAAPERYGMTGQQRALLYRLAVETGLRRNELKSLKRESFDFDACTVTVEAGYTKNGDEAVLPLRPDTAALLKDALATKLPSAAVFKVPVKAAQMLKKDLAAADIPYVDEAGRYADFHSLRHSTGSLLAASGAHPKVVQAIMRHSDINLTMSRYTHIFRGQESEAVAGLPDLSLPSQAKAENTATGTDDRVVHADQRRWEKSTPQLTPKSTPRSTPAAFSGVNRMSSVGSGLSQNRPERESRKSRSDKNLSSKCPHMSPICKGEKEKANGRIRTDNHWFTKPELYR